MTSLPVSKPLVIQVAAVSGQSGKYEASTVVKKVEYRFRWKPRGLVKVSLPEIARLTPEDLGFLTEAPEEVVNALRRAPGVEVELPAGPLAALDWESLSRRGVVRRLGSAVSRPLGRLRLPLQIACMRAKGRAQGKLPEWANQAFGRYEQAVQFRDIEVRSLADITECLASGEFDVAHVELPTSLVRGKPHLQIGKDAVPTDRVIERILAAKPLMAFFHADTDETEAAMAAMRVSCQKAPNYGTGCVLLAAPAEESDSSAFISETYSGALLDDQELGRPLELATGQRIFASIAAPATRTSLLELRPVLENEEAVAAVLASDSEKIGEPRLAPASVSGESGMYMKIVHQAKENQRSEDKLKSEHSKQSDVEGPPPKRYPAARFYHYGDSDSDEVPIPETHTVAAPAARQLEFHFWIDPVKGGISFGDATTFRPKEDKVYPFDLRARVWTDQPSLSFREERVVISIPSRGASKHARFVLARYPEHADVEFFLFLESVEGELVAAFVVRARFRPHSLPEKDAQSVHDIFLSSDYFSFQEKPGASALTLLLSMRAPGKLQLFTLKPDDKPWANLAITETQLNERNRVIYRLCTLIALEAASQETKARKISAASKNFTKLAEHGWVLFQELFAVQGDLAARKFAKDLLNFSEESRITIAMDQGASQMMVPWGLLYTDSGFREYPNSARLNGFLGHRFNVVVRPAITPSSVPALSHRPVRMAAAWLPRAETTQLEAGLRRAQDAGDLKVDKIKVEDRSLPALETDEFDLLHFYCHGHTWFPSDFRPAEFVQLLQDHKDRLQKAMPSGAEATELAEFLEQVADAPESLMMLEGGFIYRSDLSDKLAALKGAPVVLLSMCESAQVTASGAGFVTMFLQRGARAAVGTEGPTLWTLGRDLDLKIIGRLLEGQTIGEAFYQSKRELAKQNALALVYSLWGDAGARLPIKQRDSSTIHQGTIHG